MDVAFGDPNQLVITPSDINVNAPKRGRVKSSAKKGQTSAKRGRKSKQTDTHQPDNYPKKKYKKKVLYLQNVYGDPNAPQESEILCATIGYCLTNNNGTYYLHPSCQTAVESTNVEPIHSNQANNEIDNDQIPKYTISLKPFGPCMHCQKPANTFTGPRVFYVKSYNYANNTYALHGNYCSFACARQWGKEHYTPKTSIQLALLAKLAEEVYGYDGPIRCAPPSLALTINGGHIDPKDIKVCSEKYNITIHEESFITYAMMVESQPTQQQLTSAKNQDVDSTNKARLWNIRGLRAPKTIQNTNITDMLITSDTTTTSEPPRNIASTFKKRKRTREPDKDNGKDNNKQSNAKQKQPKTCLYYDFIKSKDKQKQNAASNEDTDSNTTPLQNPSSAAAEKPTPTKGTLAAWIKPPKKKRKILNTPDAPI